MSTLFPKRAERCALFIALVSAWALLFPLAAGAQSKWRTLPPTPELPQQTSGGHVDRRDALIWYATFGDETKPAVLLLHGGGGSSDYWGHLVRDLAHDFHVIVFDSRGQGRSTNEAAVLSYEQMAEDAIGVLNQLGIARAAVVGWSDGANTGFYLGLRHAARVSALIAFAGNATPAGYQPNTNPSAMTAYIARARSEYHELSPHPKRYPEVMRLLSVLWKTQPTLGDKDLATITVRTAIVHAEHDEIIRRSHSEYLARQIPGAKLVVLRGVSHFALLQDPQQFAAIVRSFLPSPSP